MERNISHVGEFGLIRIINDMIMREGVKISSSVIGIGDDAACFKPRPGYEMLVTCDAVVEGTHFILNHFTPMELGRRAMSVNISDIGAMGGHPVFSIVSLGLNSETTVEYVLALYRGFLAELNPFGAAIIGGNLTSSRETFFIDITLVGEVEEGKAIRRSTARPGDSILVTGYPGSSAAGLMILQENRKMEQSRYHKLTQAYKTPSHRAIEAKAIADSGYVTAMIDSSDGFLGDLGHICEESKVGAILVREKLPVSDDIKMIAHKMDLDPYHLVLNESDDYELIITCSPEHVDRMKSVLSVFEGLPVNEVGEITGRETGIRIKNPDGTEENLKPKGWNHFTRF